MCGEDGHEHPGCWWPLVLAATAAVGRRAHQWRLVQTFTPPSLIQSKAVGSSSLSAALGGVWGGIFHSVLREKNS